MTTNLPKNPSLDYLPASGRGKHLIVIDIETNALEFDQITNLWCICCKKVSTGETYHWTYENLDEFLKFVICFEEIVWVGHNIIGYDLPVLKKWFKGKFDYDPVMVRDTLVMSRLANQELEGGHSLANWGRILGNAKIDYHDFSMFSAEMLTYCKQDVEVTYQVYQTLRQSLKKFKLEALMLEQHTAHILSRMKQNGFSLNYPKATELLTRVTSLKDVLLNQLSSSLPMLPKLEKRVLNFNKKFKKDGSLQTNLVKALGEDAEYLEGDASYVSWMVFNPGSHAQVAWQLILKGWVPKVFTEAGAPSTSEEVLEEVYDSLPEARDIAQYFMLVKRQGQVKSWVELYNPKTKRVHGGINHIGCRTHRASHSDPNMAQIPSTRHDVKTGEILWDLPGTFNAECRNVWIAAPGYKMVGVDAAAIQLVVLAHAMGDKDYSDAVAFGDKKKGTDVHSKNRDALRETIKSILGKDTQVDYITRDVSKTFIYGFLLGAGADKTDQILGTKGIGKLIKEEFLRRTPALKALLDKLKQGVRNYKLVEGLDGRYFPCDNAHFALAYVLQGFEQAIMKKALVETQDWIDNVIGGDEYIRLLTWVHDEFQMEAKDITIDYPGCSDFPKGSYYLPELLRDKTVKIFEQVGRDFNLKCFLTGEGAIGDTWLDTH